jgi:hypothetical protein
VDVFHRKRETVEEEENIKIEKKHRRDISKEQLEKIEFKKEQKRKQSRERKRSTNGQNV